jgi:hypothetical protein
MQLPASQHYRCAPAAGLACTPWPALVLCNASTSEPNGLYLHALQASAVTLTCGGLSDSTGLLLAAMLGWGTLVIPPGVDCWAASACSRVRGSCAQVGNGVVASLRECLSSWPVVCWCGQRHDGCHCGPLGMCTACCNVTVPLRGFAGTASWLGILSVPCAEQHITLPFIWWQLASLCLHSASKLAAQQSTHFRTMQCGTLIKSAYMRNTAIATG